MVILAGDTYPLSRAAVRVARYLDALDTGQDLAATIESITQQATAVENPGLSPATPTTDLLFSWPASYWLDLRDYDQVATAAALNMPILVAQGRRDYQVTVDDDLTRWQAGLAHRPDVTIRIYDADDHMFFSGSGPSTPATYQSPQHLDPAVVTDIINWLTPASKHGPLAWLTSRLTRN